jgi:hypothetical protein
MNEAMPFEQSAGTFAAMGTAPGLRSTPVADPIDLIEDVPEAIDPREINRRAPRYLVFAGDVIVPRQKRERSDLRLGGEYLGQQFKTLVRTKGLIRRCQLTPLEIAYDFISDEMVGENQTGLQIVGTVRHDDRFGGGGAAFGSRSINAVEVFPGDEIRGIQRLNNDVNHGSRGILEVENLQDVPFADLRKIKIQETIFPYWEQLVLGVDGVQLPSTLSGLVKELNARRAEIGDSFVRDIIDTYLASAEQYRNWGISYLKMASALVRLPAHQGFVHTYSPLAEMLFDQLELSRTDDILRNPATQVGGVATENSNAQMADLMARMVAVQEQLAAQGLGIAPPVTAGPAAAPAPEEDDVFSDPPTPTHTDTEPHPVTDPKAPEANPVPPATPPAVEFVEGKCEVISSTTGEQCKRDADETGRCKHPAHSREVVE